MWLTSPLPMDDDLDVIRAFSARQRAEEQGTGQLIVWIHETRQMLWVQGKLCACLCVLLPQTTTTYIDINKEYSRSDREVLCERKKKTQTQGTASWRSSSEHQNTKSPASSAGEFFRDSWLSDVGVVGTTYSGSHQKEASIFAMQASNHQSYWK